MQLKKLTEPSVLINKSLQFVYLHTMLTARGINRLGILTKAKHTKDFVCCGAGEVQNDECKWVYRAEKYLTCQSVRLISWRLEI